MATLYWNFHDPVSGVSYSMPVNPYDMDAPEPDPSITATVAINVNYFPPMGYTTWQQKSNARPWTFSGYTYTEKQHQDLWDWVNMPNKFQLTDHLNRTWIVIFSTYDARHAPRSKTPWRHSYTIHALVYGRLA